MNRKNGYAGLIIVFIIGMVALFIGTSLGLTGYGESIMGRTTNSSLKAFYAAQAGVEDAIYKINHIANYGVSTPETFTLPVTDSSVTYTVSGTKDSRTIDAVGTFTNYVRKIHTVVQNTSVVPGFLYAVHAGSDGFELDNNTIITAKTGDGNVYSNNFIRGSKNDTDGAGNCKNSASAINGSAWAVSIMDKLGINGSGICSNKDIYANTLTYCFAKGSRSSPTTPAASCPGGTYAPAAAPTPVPLPNMNVAEFKDILPKKGTVVPGNCIADGSNSPSNCAGLTNTLGNVIITGNLIVNVPAGVQLNIAGPVWVKGTITFNSNTKVGLPQTATYSQMVVSDKQIVSNSNVTFCTNGVTCGGGTAFLLFLSTYTPNPAPSPTPTPPLPEGCTNPAITVSSNSNSVLFYAPVGCIVVTANSLFHGSVLGQKIVVTNNSTVEYDPALQSATFAISKAGGWQTQTFSER